MEMVPQSYTCERDSRDKRGLGSPRLRPRFTPVIIPWGPYHGPGILAVSVILLRKWWSKATPCPAEVALGAGVPTQA